MIPWNRLPKDLQRTISAMILLYGGTSVAGCCVPLVCDPPPPPSMTPVREGASPSPMVCDPPPPPRITPTPSGSRGTPMVCDPPPPPGHTAAPTDTPVPTRQYQVRLVKVEQDPAVATARLQGSVKDAAGRPLADVKVNARLGTTTTLTWTDGQGAFALKLPAVGSYQVYLENASTSTITVVVKAHDVATVEWTEVAGAQASLPLAEIRSVNIRWEGGLAFGAASPWPAPGYRWSASGGRLSGAGQRVIWRPPAKPGRYLLQVVADWGADGLAVDAVTLALEPDGRVLIG